MQEIKISISIQPDCTDTNIKNVIKDLENEIKAIRKGLQTGSSLAGEKIHYIITSAV